MNPSTKPNFVILRVRLYPLEFLGSHSKASDRAQVKVDKIQEVAPPCTVCCVACGCVAVGEHSSVLANDCEQGL